MGWSAVRWKGGDVLFANAYILEYELSKYAIAEHLRAPALIPLLPQGPRLQTLELEVLLRVEWIGEHGCRYEYFSHYISSASSLACITIVVAIALFIAVVVSIVITIITNLDIVVVVVVIVAIIIIIVG